MAQGRSLELYFIDGNPEGMQTAEVFNWTGHVLYFPRTQIAAALARTAAQHTGVYVLIGNDNDGPRAYVGESEDISQRIKNHDLNKDFWSHAALITTQSNNLHKAHAKYLESRLIEEARSIGRMPLENATTPARPGLSEAAQANMEEFLATLFIVLPALRIDMFLERARDTPLHEPQVEASTPPSTFHLKNKKYGVDAQAVLSQGEFIVIAGSKARRKWVGVEIGYTQLYEELCRSGILTIEGENRVFTENYAFSSPSAASSVILGRSSSGTLEWKTRSGQLYKDWESATLAPSQIGGSE